jgi:hypothetical protein
MSLKEKSIKELKKLASKHEIKGRSLMKKNQLICALKKINKKMIGGGLSEEQINKILSRDYNEDKSFITIVIDKNKTTNTTQYKDIEILGVEKKEVFGKIELIFKLKEYTNVQYKIENINVSDDLINFTYILPPTHSAISIMIPVSEKEKFNRYKTISNQKGYIRVIPLYPDSYSRNNMRGKEIIESYESNGWSTGFLKWKLSNIEQLDDGNYIIDIILDKNIQSSGNYLKKLGLLNDSYTPIIFQYIVSKKDLYMDEYMLKVSFKSTDFIHSMELRAGNQNINRKYKNRNVLCNISRKNYKNHKNRCNIKSENE